MPHDPMRRAILWVVPGHGHMGHERARTRGTSLSWRRTARWKIDLVAAPLYVIQVLHAAFWAIPLARWLIARQSRSRRAQQVDPSLIDSPEMRTAPHAAGLLGLQFVAFALFYLALGLTLLVPLSRDPAHLATPLFSPQRLVGAVVCLMAVGLHLWAVALFRSWRVLARLSTDHQIATRGPFGLVRHPIYLAMDLLALGSFLWIPTPWVLCGVVAVIATSHVRARSEEALLLAEFGEVYSDYARRVRRWIPRVL
jgi:protein-S-isoprenylcysteine O-methyltransferase Ste14